MGIRRIQKVSHSQKKRLAYIDFFLFLVGKIDQPDLINRFGVTPFEAIQDLALYREIAPQNIEFDSSKKIYRRGKEFVPCFDRVPSQVLSLFSIGLGGYLNGDLLSPIACETPLVLHSLRIDVLAIKCRTINADYGMKDDFIRVHIRAAVAAYMYLCWSLSSSTDHNLQGHEYRPWFKSHLALYGFKNALLAPGYREPRQDVAKANTVNVENCIRTKKRLRTFNERYFKNNRRTQNFGWISWRKGSGQLVGERVL